MPAVLSWEVPYVYQAVVVMCVCASHPRPEPAKFSIGSLIDAALPNMQPILAAGSSKCDALKSFFGITYEQMQQKNSADFQDSLSIDLITKNGNVKYNLTALKRLNRVVEAAKSVVILIHGFLESSDGYMVKALATEFLKQPGVKILALDGRRVIGMEYFRSSTYSRFIGEKLGSWLSDVINSGQDPSKMTLIGHSLGAHVAGIAGKQVRQLTGEALGRIVGLDPAGPCFSTAGPPSRLHSTDAEYVDAIHTNAGVLGMNESVGHKDFFPNGGASQPGCYLYTCDHSRVWELFAESIAAPDHFPARKCKNWTMFKDGQCSKNEVAYMGMGSRSGAPGAYFLSTGPSAPFGLGPTGSG